MLARGALHVGVDSRELCQTMEAVGELLLKANQAVLRHQSDDSSKNTYACSSGRACWRGQCCVLSKSRKDGLHLGCTYDAGYSPSGRAAHGSWQCKGLRRQSPRQPNFATGGYGNADCAGALCGGADAGSRLSASPLGCWHPINVPTTATGRSRPRRRLCGDCGEAPAPPPRRLWHAPALEVVRSTVAGLNQQLQQPYGDATAEDCEFAAALLLHTPRAPAGAHVGAPVSATQCGLVPTAARLTRVHVSVGCEAARETCRGPAARRVAAAGGGGDRAKSWQDGHVGTGDEGTVKMQGLAARSHLERECRGGAGGVAVSGPGH